MRSNGRSHHSETASETPEKKSHTLRKILKINFTEVFSVRADKIITATTVWQKHGSIQPITSRLTDK